MSTLRSAIQSLLGWDKAGVYNSRFISANKVVFSSYGRNIHVSDIVKTAIHRVASEVSKCTLKSIITHENPRRIEVCNDDLNSVFSARVNPMCAMRDFLYKVAWLTVVNKNCFIYWQYDEVPIEGTPYVRRVTRGLYPIECANVRLYYEGGEMRVELTSAAADIVLDMPYSDVIHVRHDYGQNPYLGGGTSGGGEYTELLRNLQTLHVIKEAIPKSLEASLSLKGILSMKTVADIDKKKITREEFENHLFDSKYGIVATDYESEFSPVNISATDIPTNILNFVRDEVLSLFGVSLPIYLGKYNDEEHTAFFRKFPSLRELYLIKCYDRLVQSLSFERRQQIAEMTKEDALLNRDERRELLGYEPDGEPTRVSLNYIDTSIANEYQMETLAAAAKKQTPAPADEENPKEGDNEN